MAHIPDRVSERFEAEEGDEVQVKVNEGTIVKVQGKDASWEDLEAGDRIFVVGKIDFENSPMSVDAKVLADRPRPPRRHCHGMHGSHADYV